MSFSQPFNFQKWIDDHREFLKPPVCNKMVFKEDGFIVMVVGGPNSRTDYHYDEGPEFFYQLEGEMVLKTVQEGKFIDIPIKEGEVFLLPPKIPHSPQRMENSVGLVIERTRFEGEKDGLMWFCDSCGEKLYEEYFQLQNIEKDLPPVFERYYSSEKHRTCKNCGTVAPTKN